MRAERADQVGAHRTELDKNRKRILATQTVCGICGRPVDKRLKYPHPLAPSIDHIIPLAKGGHPSAIDNLQLAHWICNVQKKDKLSASGYLLCAGETGPDADPFPLAENWATYKSKP